MAATSHNKKEEEEETPEISVHHQCYYYLSSTAVKELPKFHYDGADLSLTYKYVLSPFAAFLVNNVTPRSLAPNAITLIGLCWIISSYCIIWYYCPTLQGDDDAPAWIFLFNGMAMLIYQTLDNMDGKQARRTGSSSPLGLLVDHGCDAFNIVFGSANWICGMGMSSLEDGMAAVWIMVMIPMFLFYVATWEEYHCGKLILPPFNGPNEGLILGAIFSFCSFYFGRKIWSGTQIHDHLSPYLLLVIPKMIIPSNIPVLSNGSFVLLSSVVGAIQETTIKLITVVSSHGLQSLVELFPVTLLAVLPIYICHVDKSIFARNPRTCLHLCSCLFTEMVTSLMLDHMTATKFHPFRILLLPLLALAILVTYDDGFFSNDKEEMIDFFLISYSAGAAVYLAMKVKIVIHEICSLLGIWCFDIVTPHPNNNNNDDAILTIRNGSYKKIN